MKILLINPKTGHPIQSKYNGRYKVKRQETSVVKTVIFSDRDGDFCRGATYTRHIIDSGRVFSVERIKEDNFDGRGKTRCRINLIGQKYHGYLYHKPCVIIGVNSNQAISTGVK